MTTKKLVGVVGASLLATASADCDSFCTQITAECIGANQQWASKQDCLTDCATYAPGAAGDRTGNSLGCRQYHLDVAVLVSRSSHCPHAGPSGGGQCVGFCESFCNRIAGVCTGGNSQYPDLSSCMTSCNSQRVGLAGDTSGNSQLCRDYHLGVAAVSSANANVHCPHAGQDGGNVCVDTCSSFCATHTKVCADATSADSKYASQAACELECSNWRSAPLGAKVGDTSGNSLDCRIYHTDVAGSIPGGVNTHCPHATASGGGVCVDTCDEFCGFVTTKCTADKTRYTDLADCKTKCADMPVKGAAYSGGNSLQCRVYHAQVAVNAVAPEHCEHASLFGEQLDGTPVCGSACDYYCARHVKKCTGGNKLYNDVLSCVAECGKWAKGTPADTTGDTFYCRNGYLDQAAPAPSLSKCVTEPTTKCVPPAKEVVLCNLVQTNCAGQAAGLVYTDVNACVAAYTNADFPDGNLADLSQDAQFQYNTFACRLFHALDKTNGLAASKASGDATKLTTSCSVSAVGTGTPPITSVCKADYPIDCDDFCTIVTAACTGGNAAYASKAECLAACPTFAVGASTDDKVDSLHCRFKRAIQARDVSPVGNCDDTAVSGGDHCITTCADFCQNFEDTCFAKDGTDLAKYGWASITDCDTDCAKWRQGVRKESKGNSLSCRAYHLSVAAIIQPSVHCPHASSTGGGACIDGCEDFCPLFASTCATRLGSQLSTPTKCLATCAKWAVGTPGATAGDSFSCRQYHLGVATSTKDLTHCDHASGEGGNVCVATCSDFCAQATKVCPTQYPSSSTCLTTCTNFPAGVSGDTDGDSLNCRAYHLNVASQSTISAGVHCPHASPGGGGVCATQCQTFCRQNLQTCSGAQAQWASEAACLADCSTWPVGRGDSPGNTLGCRAYHLGVAATNPTVHCIHSGPAGGGVCVTDCENFCNDQDAVCKGTASQYTNKDECRNECMLGWDKGMVGDTAGNTLECRQRAVNVNSCVDTTIEGGVCKDTCESFCTQAMAVCSTTYATKSACLTACGTWGAGVAIATEGNTLACRAYHLRVAALPGNALDHCPHASASGGNVCVDPCINFCTLDQLICTNKNWANNAACATDCAKYKLGFKGATTGNTLSCRRYHLGVASLDESDTTAVTLHCGHSGPNPTEFCVDPTPTPPPASTPPTMAPAPVDNPDCKQGGKDFKQCTTVSGLFISWTRRASDYDIAVTASETGIFLGVGVGYSAMVGSEAVVGYGSAHIKKYTLGGRSADAVTVKATQGISSASVMQANGKITMMWTATGDMAPNKMIYSKGPAPASGDTLSFHTRGYGTLTIDWGSAGFAPPSIAPPSTGGTSTGALGCAEFCSEIMTGCTGTNSQFGSNSQCLFSCNGWARGTPGDSKGDSFACRYYHLGVAVGRDGGTPALAVHCPHAGKNGGGVCVDAQAPTPPSPTPAPKISAAPALSMSAPALLAFLALLA